MRPPRLFWRRLQPIRPKRTPAYRCEVCGQAGVDRRGDWDYCPVGHIYVGQRAEHGD